MTPGSADEQLFFAMLRKDAALARRIYPVAVKELGSGPAEVKRSLDAMLALAEGRGADAFRIMDPPLLDVGHLQHTALWTMTALAADRPADALRGFEFVNGRSPGVALGAMAPWMMVQHARTLAALGRQADARAALPNASSSSGRMRTPMCRCWSRHAVSSSSWGRRFHT